MLDLACNLARAIPVNDSEFLNGSLRRELAFRVDIPEMLIHRRYSDLEQLRDQRLAEPERFIGETALDARDSIRRLVPHDLAGRGSFVAGPSQLNHADRTQTLSTVVNSDSANQWIARTLARGIHSSQTRAAFFDRRKPTVPPRRQGVPLQNHGGVPILWSDRQPASSFSREKRLAIAVRRRRADARLTLDRQLLEPKSSSSMAARKERFHFGPTIPGSLGRGRMAAASGLIVICIVCEPARTEGILVARHSVAAE